LEHICTEHAFKQSLLILFESDLGYNLFEKRERWSRGTKQITTYQAWEANRCLMFGECHADCTWTTICIHLWAAACYERS